MNKSDLKKLIQEVINEIANTKTTQFGVPVTMLAKDINHPHDVIVLVDTNDESLKNSTATLNVETGSFDTLTIKVTVNPPKMN